LLNPFDKDKMVLLICQEYFKIKGKSLITA